MTIQKPKIRSSSLPLLMSCTNAVLNPDGLLRVEDENPSAGNGTLVHSVCEMLVKTGELETKSLKQRMEEADYDRALVQINNFHKVWKEASFFMKEPVTEWAFEFEIGNAFITGHIDVHHVDPLRAFIIDYKTGRQHEDHFHQMAAYAFGVWDKAGRPENFTVYVTAVYLEDNSVHPYEFTASNLVAWAAEVDMQVTQLRYTAGRKCAGCPLQDSCPAYRAYGRNATGLFTEEDAIPGQSWEEMTAEQRGALVDKMYVVEKAIDRAKLGLRNLVKSKGQVDVGGGKAYVLVESEERRINPERAARILSRRLPDYHSLAAYKLDEVLSAFAARAPRGSKTLARKQLMEELEEAGAITRSTVTKMWRRPIGEKVLDTGK